MHKQNNSSNNEIKENVSTKYTGSCNRSNNIDKEGRSENDLREYNSMKNIINSSNNEVLKNDSTNYNARSFDRSEEINKEGHSKSSHRGVTMNFNTNRDTSSTMKKEEIKSGIKYKTNLMKFQREILNKRYGIEFEPYNKEDEFTMKDMDKLKMKERLEERARIIKEFEDYECDIEPYFRIGGSHLFEALLEVCSFGRNTKTPYYKLLVKVNARMFGNTLEEQLINEGLIKPLTTKEKIYLGLSKLKRKAAK